MALDVKLRQRMSHHRIGRITAAHRGQYRWCLAIAWQLALWAENLFDTEYADGYNAIASDLNAPYIRRNKPRFYGIEAIYSW